MNVDFSDPREKKSLKGKKNQATHYRGRQGERSSLKTL